MSNDMYKRLVRVGKYDAIRIHRTKVTTILNGWGDYVRDHTQQLQKVDTAFNINPKLICLNYEAWLVDALQEELLDRTGYMVAFCDLRTLEREASASKFYEVRLSLNMFALEIRLRTNPLGLSSPSGNIRLTQAPVKLK
jgi:hypothetical protein